MVDTQPIRRYKPKIIVIVSLPSKSARETEQSTHSRVRPTRTVSLAAFQTLTYQAAVVAFSATTVDPGL